MGRAKTLAQQIAELDEPIANGMYLWVLVSTKNINKDPDYDPEEHSAPIDSDEESDSGSENELNGTEHYVNVGYVFPVLFAQRLC